MSYICDTYHHTLKGENYNDDIMLDLEGEELIELSNKDKVIERYMKEIKRVNEIDNI